MKNGKKRAKTLEQKLTTQIKKLREEMVDLEIQKEAIVKKTQAEIEAIENRRTKEAMHVCSLKTEGLRVDRENEKIRTTNRNLKLRLRSLKEILEAQGFIGEVLQEVCCADHN